MPRAYITIGLRLYGDDIALSEEIRELARKSGQTTNELVVLLMKRGLEEYKKGEK